MKYAFFIVVLVNLVFYLWEGQSGKPQPAEGSANSASSSQQIQLLSEITSTSSSDAIAEHQVDAISPQEPDMTIPEDQDLSAGEMQISELQDTELQNEEAITALIPENQQSSPAEAARLDDDSNHTINDSNTTPEAYDSRANRASEAIQQNLNNGLERPESEEVVANPAVKQPPKQTSAPNLLTKQDNLPEATDSLQKDVSQCLEVGPFDNPTHLSGWLNKKHFDRSQIETFSRNTRIVSDYIVYFPAADTMAESEENISVLRNMGVNDVWLFRQGELKGAISLGIFVRKSRAELVRDEMVRRGVAAQITERYEELPRLFVKLYQDSSFQPGYPLTATPCQP